MKIPRLHINIPAFNTISRRRKQASFTESILKHIGAENKMAKTNGLVPNMQQAIILASDDIIQMTHMCVTRLQ